MGDTGSLALGGALGAMAVATKHEIVLGIIGGLFVLETLSVMIQVAYFKATGKRVFLMAPIHHHFEKLGWKESTSRDPLLDHRHRARPRRPRHLEAEVGEARALVIPVRGFEGKRVAVFGLARTGLTAARALIAGGAKVALWDEKAAARDEAAAEGPADR